MMMLPERPPGEPAVLLRRGPVVESLHRAVIAVAGADGKLQSRLGDPAAVTYLRSSAKPFQTLPLIASGGADAFGISDDELAIMAGSHGGEDRHVKAVETILSKIGLTPAALQCGLQRPYHAPTAERLGSGFSVLHHNCSGKHSGLLALAVHLGVDPAAYIDPASAGQKRILRTLAEVAGVRISDVRIGIDGCSAPNFALPLKAAAVAFARLGTPDQAPRGHGEALKRVRDAMLAHPAMVAGEGRFDTALMETFQGTLVSKSGAEGFEGVAVPARGLGVAVKVEDGNTRAVPPVVVAALRQLKIATKGHETALAPHLGRIQKNWAGLEVGKLEAKFRLRPHGRRS